jgi:4-hydroxy-tetrahydrodipicolinate reductase
MNIALIGYGKMGKEIERLALERGMTIVARIDSQSPSLSDEITRTTDVAIHFATPSSVLGHIEQWAGFGKNMVVGTTGWQNELAKVQSIVSKNNIGLVYASNFSLGVNILLNLVKQAGILFNNFTEYDVFLHEIHHKDKLDSPSGTALTLADVVLKTMKRKKEILSETAKGKIKPEQLHVTSTRAGAVIGTHRVTFDSIADSIELTHTAKNRTGFALGALLAAEWIQGKRGIFTMEDVLSNLLQS